jgi:dihydroorotase
VAEYGAPGLETCFGASRKALGDRIPLERLIDRFAQKPRELMGMEGQKLQEGEPLEATLFDPDQEWTCERKDLRSKAYRSPYLGELLRGRPLGSVHQGLFHPIDE